MKVLSFVEGAHQRSGGGRLVGVVKIAKGLAGRRQL